MNDAQFVVTFTLGPGGVLLTVMIAAGIMILIGSSLFNFLQVVKEIVRKED